MDQPVMAIIVQLCQGFPFAFFPPLKGFHETNLLSEIYGFADSTRNLSPEPKC
jgi:hypothetical protein